MSEIKDKLITAENLKNAYDDNKRAINELKDELDDFYKKSYLSKIEQFGLPVLYINNEDVPKLISKADGDVKDVDFKFVGYNLNGKFDSVKVQGSSSQKWAKKNYTIKFKDAVNLGWGKQKKYVIKADWVDFSQIRNEVSANLWGQIRRNRLENLPKYLVTDSSGKVCVDTNTTAVEAIHNTNPSLFGLNYGAIDAKPIIVVINGEYWGLYSLTIPKDGWMANMTANDTYNMAIVCADGDGSTYCRLRETQPVDDNGELTGNGFNVEFASNGGDNPSWVATSLNTMIEVLNQSHVDWETDLEPYLDIDSVIDYYIMMCVICHTDGMFHNYLLDTWDGTRWYMIAYDMDSTWGNHWYGDGYYSPNETMSFLNFANQNRAMEVVYKYFKDRLVSRYEELRKTILSESNLMSIVWNYAIKIPKATYDYEAVRWSERPGTNTNSIYQMILFINERLSWLDKEIQELKNNI